MDEEELDYEGPLFSQDPYFLRAQDLTSEECACESETDEKHKNTVSCASNNNVHDYRLIFSKAEADDQADKREYGCKGGAGAATRRADRHLATPEQASKTLLSHYNQDSRNVKSLNLSSQSLKPTPKPEAEKLVRQPQTVQVVFSSMIPGIPKSGNSTNSSKNSAPVRHNVKQRSILKVKENPGSYNKVIDKCMSFLCTIPSSSELLSGAKEVFENACFNEFFDGGCFRKICLKDHYNVPNITNCHSFTVQIASLYVIFKSTSPKIEILRSLVRYFSSCCDSIRTLALAKCISKLKSADKNEFTQCLVKHLADLTERKNAVMWVLFMTYSDLKSHEFNLLLDDLGVFQQDSTIYFDLLNFLNFRAHVLPRKNLVKLIEDVLTHHSHAKSIGFVVIIFGFLDRLPDEEKGKMGTVVSRLIGKFKIGSLEKPEPSTGIGGNITIPKLHCSTSNYSSNVKKRVTFVEDMNIARISNFGLATIQDDNLQPLPEFDDDENGSNFGPILNSDYNSMFEDTVGSVLAVFNNLCPDWILKGDCQKPKCSATHFLQEDSFDSIPREKINLAVEFLIETCDRPNIKVLEIFINVLNRSNNIEKLLSFRKCASKLTAADSLKLTTLVLSRLSRHLDRWDAIEMMLTPNLLDIGNKLADLFHFDSSLLESIMIEAINKKMILLRCISDEILRRVSKLQSNEMENILETTVKFLRKFILNQCKLPPCPDLIPMESVVTNKFSSYFKTELHKGVTNNYFVVCLMLKFVAERGDGLKNEALDSLYTFLNIQFSKARILNDMLENCIFFKETSRVYVKDLLGNIGLCSVLRLYEDGNIAEASEIFVVLRKFDYDLFKQEHKFFQVSYLELALIFCDLTVQCDEHTDAIELLLDRCLQYVIDNTVLGSSLINRINALTENMFRKFICKLLWRESLALFNGIYSRQKSLTYPLNILKFYESTLRTTLASPWNQRARLACLQFFLEKDPGEHVELQKATCRSLLLNATTEVYESYQKIFSKRALPNLFHPLIKKLIALCIKAGAYSQFTSTGDQITLYSSMTVDEIKIYLLWWVFYLLRARKRANLDYFGSVNLTIIQDSIQEDFRLPIHFTLQKIDVSVLECGDRLFKALKSLMPVPVTSALFKIFGRGTFQLSPTAVMELSNVVINCLLTHQTDEFEQDLKLCTFCFEKNEMGFSLV